VNKLELIKKLYDIGAIKLGDFTLKSGKKSPYYIDLRILPSFPTVLKEVGEVMGKMIMNLPEKPTRLCGIPAAGLAIANAIAMQTGLPVVYTRKEPIVYKELTILLRNLIKENKCRSAEIPGIEKAVRIIEEWRGLKTHGIARYVDGEIKNGDRIGIVDDLITTGESKIENAELVKLEAKRMNIKVDILGIYVLLDREEGGREFLEGKGLSLFSTFTISEVMKYLYEVGLLEDSKYNLLINYIRKNGKIVKKFKD
jgi:uridine monophosphate synthetase